MVRRTSLKNDFNSKARRPVFTLKNAVAEAYDMFPEFAEEVFFIDLKANKTVHSDPVMRQRLIDLINANEDVRATVNVEKFYARLNKSSVCMPVEFDGKNLRFMALYLENDMQNIFDEDHSLHETRFSVFDHEFAHAVIPEAHGGSLRHEMIADAYMALRHFQRFGADSKTVEDIMQRRAVMAFFNQDKDHFTSPALEKVIEFNRKYDIVSLTPQQTARLAVHIAKKSMLDEKTVQSLSRQFNKFKGALATVENDGPARKLAEKVMAAKSPAMKKWGRVALSGFLDRSIHLKKLPKNGRRQTISLRGKYWDDMRLKAEEMKKAEKSIQKKPRSRRVS